MQRLSSAQLAYLGERMGATVENTHNLEDELERFWCYEAQTSRTAHGYPYVTLLKKEHQLGDNTAVRRDQRFLCSHVALALAGQFAASASDEASHLCANPLCVRPSHLTWESHVANMSRIKCLGFIGCSCGNCHDYCQHEPKCKIVRLLP